MRGGGGTAGESEQKLQHGPGAITAINLTKYGNASLLLRLVEMVIGKSSVIESKPKNKHRYHSR